MLSDDGDFEVGASLSRSIGNENGTLRRSERVPRKSFQHYFSGESGDESLDSDDSEKPRRRGELNGSESGASSIDDAPVVDKMLALRDADWASRRKMSSGSDTFSPPHLVGDGPHEILVKWKNRSYLHVEWVHEDRIRGFRAGMASAIQRFKAKFKAGRMDWLSEDDDEWFNPRFLDVDVILSEDQEIEKVVKPDYVADLEMFEFLRGHVLTKPGLVAHNDDALHDLLSPEARALYSTPQDKLRHRYFVKWCDLSYKDCTWEYAEDIQDDLKIAMFHRINRVPNVNTRAKSNYEEDDATLALWPALSYLQEGLGEQNLEGTEHAQPEQGDYTSISATMMPISSYFVQGRRVRGTPEIPLFLSQFIFQGEGIGLLPGDEILAVENVSMHGESFNGVTSHIAARVNNIRHGLTDSYTITFRRFVRRFDKPGCPLDVVLFNVRFGNGRLGFLLESFRSKVSKSPHFLSVGRPPRLEHNDAVIVGELLPINSKYYDPNSQFTHWLANKYLRTIFFGYIAMMSHFIIPENGPNAFTDENHVPLCVDINLLMVWTGMSAPSLTRWMQGWPICCPMGGQPDQMELAAVKAVEGALFTFMQRANLIHQFSTYGLLSQIRLMKLLCGSGEAAAAPVTRRLTNMFRALDYDRVLEEERMKSLGRDARRRLKQRLAAGEHLITANHRMQDMARVASVLDNVIRLVEDDNFYLDSSHQEAPQMYLAMREEPMELMYDGKKNDRPDPRHEAVSRWLKQAMKAIRDEICYRTTGYISVEEVNQYSHRLAQCTSLQQRMMEMSKREKQIGLRIWCKFVSEMPILTLPCIGEVPETLQRDLHRRSVQSDPRFLVGYNHGSGVPQNPNEQQGIIAGFKEQQRMLRQLDHTTFVPYTERTQPRFKSGNMLRSYQLHGINWILSQWYSGRNAILADEMGLGKTVQVIATFNHLRVKANMRGPFLVVAPLSTIGHWHREVENWTDMVLCRYYDSGSVNGRDVIRSYEWYYPDQKGRNDLLKFNIMVTTYESFIADIEHLERLPWLGVVVDEAHRIKTRKSRLLEMLMRLSDCRRLLLTGTPLQNNISELWSLLNFCDNRVFQDPEIFLQRFGDMRNAAQLDELQRVISPYMLRRVKEDVEKSIPPKEETIIDVELTMFQKRYYRAIFDKNRAVLYRGCKGGNKPQLINVEMELRKCCNHPFLISGVQDAEHAVLTKDFKQRMKSSIEEIKAENSELGKDLGPDDRSRNKMISNLLVEAKERGLSRDEIFDLAELEHTIRSSGKLVLVDKLLPKLRAEGHKVLIFSQFVRMLDLIEYVCRGRGFPVERLDGSIHGNRRQAAIDRFSDPKHESFIFLLSTRAGGMGINLTAADTVIIYDSDWNPQNDAQAQARCHRIGQKRSVMVFRLVTKNTYEESMLKRAAIKLGLERAVLGSVNELSVGNKANSDSNKGVSGRDLSVIELEKMLRDGAYHHLQDDDKEDGDAFIGADIDDLLKTHSRVVVSSGIDASDRDADARNVLDKLKHNTVNKSSFKAEREDGIDINDPEFWMKVLPDLASPDSLLSQLNEESSLSGLKQSRETRLTFMENVRSLVKDIVIQRSSGETVSEHDMDTTQSLLVQISNMKAIFGADSFDEQKRFDRPYAALTARWLSRMEVIRERRMRRSGGDAKVSRLGLSDGDSDDGLFSEIEEDSEAGEMDASTRAGPRTRGRKPKTKKGRYTEPSSDVEDEIVESGFSDAEELPEVISEDCTTDVCAVCADGGDLIVCEGPCKLAFHLKCLDDSQRNQAEQNDEWFCSDCEEGRYTCLCCGKTGKRDALDDSGVVLCSHINCGRFVHLMCVEDSPKGTVVDLEKKEILCPLHLCVKCNDTTMEATVFCIRCTNGYHAKCLDHKRTLRLHQNLCICSSHFSSAELKNKRFLESHMAFDRNFVIRSRKARSGLTKRGRRVKRPRSKTADRDTTVSTKRKSKKSGKREEDVVDIVELDWRAKDEAEGLPVKDWSGNVMRTCALCTQDGLVYEESDDDDVETKTDYMVPFPFLQRKGQGFSRVWIHERCAIYSPEVLVDDLKQYHNVMKAVRRGRFLSCQICGQRGATLGCSLQKCNKSYHIPCAVSGGWDAQGGIQFVCKEHSEKSNKKGKKDQKKASAKIVDQVDEKEATVRKRRTGAGGNSTGATANGIANHSTYRKGRADSDAYSDNESDEDYSQDSDGGDDAKYVRSNRVTSKRRRAGLA